MQQRRRELVSSSLTLDYFVQKAAEGWTLAAVEWVREVSDRKQEPVQFTTPAEDLPYGLRLTDQGTNVERNPLEMTVLLLILERIIQEKRVTEIAADLNRSGFLTRKGSAWTASEVFELLPRLIEAGPALLKSPAWLERRPASGPTN